MSKLTEWYDYIAKFTSSNPDYVGIYVSGGQGEESPKLCDSWIRRMERDDNNYTRALNGYKAAQRRVKDGQTIKAFDCSGLIMYYFQNISKIVPKDYTANGIYTLLCNPIEQGQLYRGDLVFRANSEGRVVHCGIVTGTDPLTVLESKGRADGVIVTRNSDWNRYGRLKCIAAEIEQREIFDVALKILEYLINDIAHAIDKL